MKDTARDKGNQFRGASQLFLVRVWPRRPAEGMDRPEEERSCHGKVQHAVTGETYYFHNGAELLEVLLRMSCDTANVRPGSAP